MSQSNSNDGTSKGDEYLLNLFLTDEGIANPAVGIKNLEMSPQSLEVHQVQFFFQDMRIAEWYSEITD